MHEKQVYVHMHRFQNQFRDVHSCTCSDLSILQHECKYAKRTWHVGILTQSIDIVVCHGHKSRQTTKCKHHLCPKERSLAYTRACTVGTGLLF